MNTAGNKVDSGNVGTHLGDDTTKAGTAKRKVAFNKTKGGQTGSEWDGFESG